jgi:hypothetical protein
MTNTTTPSASDSGLNLDHLEALARAATPGPWQQGRLLSTPQTRNWPKEERERADREERSRVFANFSSIDDGRARQNITNCRDEADAQFIAAANPATVLGLIALARRAARVSAAIAIQPWEDRASSYETPAFSKIERMEAEIAELRAALANQPAPTAAPEQVAQGADERALFEAHCKRKMLPVEPFGGPCGRHLYADQHTRDAWDAWQAARALSQPSEAAPLDAYEMTRLRRLMKALGQEDAFERDDAHVRGSLCVVLGIAAGRIEGALPGPGAAPAAGDELPPLPAPMSVEMLTYPHGFEGYAAGQMRDYARAALAHQPAQEQADLQCTIGVGNGSGRLFVHGDHDSIMAVRRIIIENESLRAAQQEPAQEQAAPQVPKSIKRILQGAAMAMDMMHAPQAAQHEAGDERAAFEKALKLDQFQKRPHAVIEGDYQESSTQCAWNGWQARAALTASPVVRAQSEESALTVAWTYDMDPPQGFVDYVSRNYTGNVFFSDPAWHARRLWNAAMRSSKAPADTLRALRRLLDGTQPLDVPGAVMVIDAAIRAAQEGKKP